MGAVSYSSSSGSFNVPSVVQRVWVSCVGGGGGGITSYTRNGNSAGGGGWGYGAVNVSSTTISYVAGAGGSPFNAGGTSSCLGIVAGGGGPGNATTLSYGGGFSAPNGVNGLNLIYNSTGDAGNPAGAIFTGNPQVIAGLSAAIEVGENAASVYYTGEGGGYGNNGFGQLTIAGNGYFTESGETVGANGANYGGGGGSARAGPESNLGGEPENYPRLIAGSGGAGLVYVSWIDITAGATTLRSGESTTVSWSSPWGSNSQTVSFTNNGTTNTTETFTAIDSRGAQSTITFTVLPAVRITSFTANPNPQTSGLDGVPNFDTALTWVTVGATSASITNIGTVAGNGSTTITDLPQSVAGSNSPATRTYTLTASDGFNTVSSPPLTVQVFNDNTPNNYSISNRTNLEPDTFYIVDLGDINGIDMVTNVIGGPEVTVSKNNLQNYISSITIVNTDSVQLRFRSDPFNIDPIGQPTALKSLYVDIGTVRRFFTISTRAPDVNETFNLSDETGRVPFPDIDTINDPSLPYITSQTLSIDDIELQNPNGVEIKTDNDNIQIRIRRQGASTFSDWIDARSI